MDGLLYDRMRSRVRFVIWYRDVRVVTIDENIIERVMQDALEPMEARSFHALDSKVEPRAFERMND